MSLNFNLLKEKLSKMDRQKSEQKDSLWRPPEGKSIIRIVPRKEDRTYPFVELSFHYGFGKKPYLSPTSYGRPDPIVEFGKAIVDELFQNNNNPTKDEMRETYARAKPFSPSLRTFIPIIVRGEEDKGVRYMSFGQTVFTDIATIMNDEDYGDITDVKSGTDIVVEYIPKEKSDTKYAKTKVFAKRNQSPLADSPEKINEFLNNQPDLTEIFKEPTYEELLTVLSTYLGTDVPVDEPTVNVPLTSATATKSVETKSKAVDDFMDEFDQAFN